MLKAEICIAWLILGCGQVMFWWRRDNLLGYLQAGFFFATIAVPVLATTIVDDLDPVAVNRYADILTVGAFAYLAGLTYGAFVGTRWRLPRVLVGAPLDPVPAVLVRRARQAALGGLGILALSFLLLGYVPLLTADRVSAKYGVGVYQAGFARGSLFLHVGLLLSGTILPVILALYLRRRRRVDLLLAGALFVGVLVTLSRGRAFTGPLVFLIAWAVERRWRSWGILAAVCFTFIAGTLFNEIASLATTASGTSFASRVAASAPDITDHVAFLSGFEARGAKQVGLKPILAGISLDKGENNASLYALRIRTGLDDVTGLPSGGLRLPAPVWGYASYGYPGVVAWSLLSGIAIGWGTSALRRLLALRERRRPCLNLVLAWVLYQGTFLVLGEFYFFERVGLVSLALALFLCWLWPRSRRSNVDGTLSVSGSPPPGSSSPDWRDRSGAPIPRRPDRPPERGGRMRSSRLLRGGGSPRRTSTSLRSW